MPKLNILLVDDEHRLAALIEQMLSENEYEVTTVYNGSDALEQAFGKDFDCIVLDRAMPGIDGIQVCQQLKDAKVKTPILMLTAMGTLQDKVSGLEAGADDYLLKPFEMEELLARVKSLIRRAGKNQSEILSFSDVEMNLDTRTVTRAGVEISLTQKEFQLLEYFLKNPEKVVTRAEITERVWNIGFDTGTNIIDVYVTYLRRKLEKPFNDSKLIHTSVGAGYILRLDK